MPGKLPSHSQRPRHGENHNLSRAAILENPNTLIHCLTSGEHVIHEENTFISHRLPFGCVRSDRPALRTGPARQTAAVFESLERIFVPSIKRSSGAAKEIRK